MELVAGFGIRGKRLSDAEALSLEPSLKPGILGGVYFPDEAHAEPLAVVERLQKEAVEAGAVVFTGCEVLDFEPGMRSQIHSLKTTRGVIQADQFVLAAGVFSNALSRRLGVRAPILGGKGYAVIVDPLEVQPRVPLMLVEKKIAVTPRNGSLRLAGTMEIVGTDLGVTLRRVNAILRGSREFLGVPPEARVHEVWRGLRPCTPDGLPMIGRSRRIPNLVYACGHQMLGLQTGTGTGRWVAELVQGLDTTGLDARLVSPDRF
jgi:D-amino-acid dehydrogenase